MGASGSAWIKPKKRKGLRPELFANTPHPRRVRVGQRYFPLASRATNVATLRVTRVRGELCELRREDDAGRAVRVRAGRLLATGDDDAALYYRFVGFAPSAGHPTVAAVVSTGPAWTRLVFPEWHPGVAVPVATGSLPSALRQPGTWLACRADLSADAGARLLAKGFDAVASDFDPEAFHPIAVAADALPAPRPVGDAGEGCGDVVLFLSLDELHTAMTGQDGIYLTGHPPPLHAGGRAYLHAAGEVRGWRATRGLRRLPAGVRILLEGPWNDTAVAVPVHAPGIGLEDGHHGQQRWAWRSWPREP
jgi:hypothetical protein